MAQLDCMQAMLRAPPHWASNSVVHVRARTRVHTHTHAHTGFFWGGAQNRRQSVRHLQQVNAVHLWQGQAAGLEVQRAPSAAANAANKATCPRRKTHARTHTHTHVCNMLYKCNNNKQLQYAWLKSLLPEAKEAVGLVHGPYGMQLSVFWLLQQAHMADCASKGNQHW